MDFIKDFTITPQEHSQTSIEGEIPFAELEKHKKEAIKHLGKDLTVDGFRKGNIPENIVVERVGEMAVLSEMAERALSEVYPLILQEYTIDAIGYPQINITKIAQDNPLGFTATVATMPEITLPNYKQIATDANKDKKSTEVTDTEVEKQIEDIIRQKIAYERLQNKAEQKTEAEKTQKDETPEATDLPTPETVGNETKTHTHADGTVHEGPAHDQDDVDTIELPELTDEYVQTLGQPGQFTSVDDFKAKIKEHLTIEKEREVTAAHRAKITDSIIDASQMDLPQVLIDSEMQQMFAQMNEDLTRANLNMEDYLQHIKKTKEDLQKEWEPAAKKRAQLQLILNEIAKKEEIKPDSAVLDEQVDQLMEQYKDADEARVRTYVASVLTNEAAMKMLEQQ